MSKILVIEDEQPLLEEVLDVLGFEGFEAIGAANGRVGVQLAREYLPDLIICDIMMPELDGYGVLLELRAEPATATIPFIFLTAKADRQAMRAGMESGADDYLTKPFTHPELLAAIHSRLERQAAFASEYGKKLDELRGNIVHLLPHELRTPLTGILGFSALLLQDADTLEAAEVVELAQFINKAGRRLHRLIENFLIYAQLELIKLDPERIASFRRLRSTKAGLLIAQQATLKAEDVDRQRDLVVDVAEEETVQVGEDDLMKIVEELVDNAFKFSEPGTPVRVVTTIENGWYVLQISDHGRGMTPEQITNVGAYMQFERKLHEQQGTGLGLIIARRLAELHGGEVAIESIPGQQTTVQVALPLG